MIGRLTSGPKDSPTVDDVLSALPPELAAAVRLAGGRDVGVRLVVRPDGNGRLTADVEVEGEVVATDVLGLGSDDVGYCVAFRDLWLVAFELGVTVVKSAPWGTTTSRRAGRGEGRR